MLPFHGFGRTIYPPEPTRQPLALRRIRYSADNALGLARPSGLNASIAPGRPRASRGRPGASGASRGVAALTGGRVKSFVLRAIIATTLPLY